MTTTQRPDDSTGIDFTAIDRRMRVPIAARGVIDQDALQTARYKQQQVAGLVRCGQPERTQGRGQLTPGPRLTPKRIVAPA